jgi:hypothetical protein
MRLSNRNKTNKRAKNKPGVPCKAIDFAKHAWLYFIKSLSGPT